MSDKPIYGPLSRHKSPMGDDRPQCGGYNTQESERAVAGDTGGQEDDVELQPKREVRNAYPDRM